MAVGLAVALVGLGVFTAIAAVADRSRQRPRLALAGLTVLVPLGLAIGVGWSGFDDAFLIDINAERIGVPPKLERDVHSCAPAFKPQPRYQGFGLTEPVCTDDARLRRGASTWLLGGAAVAALALVLLWSLARRQRATANAAP